jgi:hypothetical protein
MARKRSGQFNVKIEPPEKGMEHGQHYVYVTYTNHWHGLGLDNIEDMTYLRDELTKYINRKTKKK